MKTIIRYMLTVGLLWLSNPAMALVLIGTDDACDYQTNAVSIQSLIASGEQFIRITNQAVVTESIQISKSAIIKGGYNNCTDANQNVISNKKTTISGNQSGPVIKINSPNNGTDLTVYLSDLKISNGVNSSFHMGGGVSVYDTNDNVIRVTIEDSLISNNKGNKGGGIYIYGSKITLGMYDTVVLNNEVVGTTVGNALGGGVYCAFGKFAMFGDSGISGNEAFSSVVNAGNGGGLYAAGGCEVMLEAGTAGGLFDFAGINNNQASSHGGGIYLTGEARIRAVSAVYQVPININANAADSNHTGIGDGGGIYMEGLGTRMEVSGLMLTNNDAAKGGGAAIKSQSSLTVFLEGNCWSRKKCNQLSDNRASTDHGKGGALYLNDGVANISYAHMTENKADDGSVLFSENESSVVLGRSLIYQNGSGGADGWDDLTAYETNNGNIIMTHITSALNNAQFVTFREVNGQHHISNSIFYETVTNKLASLTNASGVTACLMADNDVGIGANFDDRIIADPHLTGDFHLSAGSPAIDRCSEILNNASNTELDIDGEMAPFDYPGIVNGTGLLDIGADEFVDAIFSDSFE